MQGVKIVEGCHIKMESEMKNIESQGVPLDPCFPKEQLDLSCVKCSSPSTPSTIKPADMSTELTEPGPIIQRPMNLLFLSHRQRNVHLRRYIHLQVSWRAWCCLRGPRFFLNLGISVVRLNLSSNSKSLRNASTDVNHIKVVQLFLQEKN